MFADLGANGAGRGVATPSCGYGGGRRGVARNAHSPCRSPIRTFRHDMHNMRRCVAGWTSLRMGERRCKRANITANRADTQVCPYVCHVGMTTDHRVDRHHRPFQPSVQPDPHRMGKTVAIPINILRGCQCALHRRGVACNAPNTPMRSPRRSVIIPTYVGADLRVCPISPRRSPIRPAVRPFAPPFANLP